MKAKAKAKAKKLPKRTTTVQIGWVVKARVPVRRKQWFPSANEFREIEVLQIKVISQNFLSEEAANVFRDIAAREGLYPSVWVSENYGEDDIV